MTRPRLSGILSLELMATYVIRIARRAGLVVFFVAAVLLGSATGGLVGYAGDLPQISALDDYAPSTISRLYAGDGRTIGEFATERRMPIGYDEIAPVLRQALIATEDGGFEQHFGLSVSRIVVTAARDVWYGQRYGASTITQQVARILFLQDEYMRGGVYARSGLEGLERKIKEALLAIQLEKRYTKREILTFYANHVPLGHGAYGVESAARMYLDKSASELTLDEAAMIAAIIQTPSRLSPFVNPDQTLARRNDVVLPRMVANGFITPEQAAEAADRPLVLSTRGASAPSVAPYFVEEIRKRLQQRYGTDALYHAGLQVQTTLDLELQVAASAALDRGLRRVDKRGGFRAPETNVLAEGHTIDDFRTARWDRPMQAGDVIPALVEGVEGPTLRLRAGPLRVTIDKEGYAWTGKSPGGLVRHGDLVETRLLTVGDDGVTATGALEQPPAVEGAVLAIENRTGRIRAMVGGFSFARSRFNRATQAYRQVGSGFKPFVYAAAIDRGYTPATMLMDEPTTFDAGAGEPAYAPLNYDHRFLGPMTLRSALEQSRNIPAVRLMERLGPAEVIGYAHRLGLDSPLPPYLSVALGAAEATLLEMTSAYSVFPSRGMRMRPYAVLQVRDRDGNVLEENRPEAEDAIRADTAYVMTSLLGGVVHRGTARAAAVLSWPIGGKTGTTDDYTDAWFIGFDPEVTIGVWIGYDRKKTTGPAGTGSATALPVWIDIMKAWIGDRTARPAFEPPANIVFAWVDRETGEPVFEGAPGAILEAFISGTQPGNPFGSE